MASGGATVKNWGLNGFFRLKNRFETSLKLEPCRTENDEEYRSFGFIDDVEELGEVSFISGIIESVIGLVGSGTFNDSF